MKTALDRAIGDTPVRDALSGAGHTLHPDVLHPDVLHPDVLHPDVLHPDVLHPDVLNDLQAVIDSLGDELLVIGRDGAVVRVNAAVQRRLGNAVAAGGLPCCEVARCGRWCALPNGQCPLSAVLQGSRTFRATQVCRENGSDRYIEVTASPLAGSNGEMAGVVQVWRDITAEMRLEDTILERNRQLSAANAIARAVGQSLKLDECLRLALTEVRRITGMDVGLIFLLEGDERMLRLQTSYGISEEGARQVRRLALTDSACGGVLHVGNEVVVQTLSHRARSYRALVRDGLETLVHVPLIAKGTPVGTLCLGTRRPQTLTAEESSLLTAVGSQIALAVENARLYEELIHKEQLRGDLLRRVISAQEEERKRIARELHDETSQTLSALLFTLDAAAEACTAPQTDVLLGRVRSLTVSALDELHKLIYELRPTMLDQLGLLSAIRWYAETRLGDLRLDITHDGAAYRLDPAVETALFRTVQEAVNNIARHSGARRTHLNITFDAERIEITIDDDGIGFDVTRVADARDPQRGLGLMSMQERMSIIGGAFHLSSLPGQGTHIVLQAPATAVA